MMITFCPHINDGCRSDCACIKKENAGYYSCVKYKEVNPILMRE